METGNSFARQKSLRQSALARRRGRRVLFFFAILLLALACAPLYAQSKSEARPTAKLPSPERIVGDYLKAVGGKKRLAAIRDATYSWTVRLKEQELGEARTQVKAPHSMRRDMIFGNGEINTAANASSAWERGLDGRLRTLVGTEASTARLRAMLEASRLVDYKKLNVLARTVALDETTGEPAYVVEFSMRNGARLRHWFSARSKLLLKTSDEASKSSIILMDYRAEAGLLEPHRMDLDVSGSGALTLTLKSARYNTGIDERVFDPPQTAEALNVPALLREVSRNQDAIDERVSEYTFTQKITEREINARGETKKETVRVYEVYPLPNRRPVTRLISEQGVPLSPERAAKEEKRVTDELVRAEQNREKDKLKREQEKQKRQREREERARKASGGGATAAAEGEDEELGISQFLRACEFVSPRTERFRERDAVVFDFRPRTDFRPSSREEEIISKLVGVVWIDPVDKQVMRLEARLSEGFKMGAGLLLKLSPGAAFVMEQTRMSDGVWLPRFAQINLSVRVLLFGGGSVNNTYEWSDYKRFNAETSGYKIGSPATDNPAEGKPNQ
ncbi:MAG TPA: hypothetical protein VF735_17065 [Pyrinomonadaceae bacterium]|jgi:hypothetical protein